jgi:hypothetical protein
MKHHDEDFTNVHSIETARDRIKEASTAAERFQDIGEELRQGGWHDLFQGNATGFVAGLAGAHVAQQQSGINLNRADKINDENSPRQHEERLSQIEANHAGDSALGQGARIAAEQRAARDRATENRNYAQMQDARSKNSLGPDAGKAEQDIANQTADKRASAERTQLARKEREEIAHAQNEAVNSGLRGEDLYRSQRQQSIVAITRKFQQGELSKQAATALTSAAGKKCDNETLKRLQNQREETQKLGMQGQMAGNTGAGKIRGEADVQQFDLAAKVMHGELDPDEYWKRQALIEANATAEMGKDQQTFFERVKELSDSSADHQISGYGRIRSEANKEPSGLKKDFEEHTRGLDKTSGDYSQYSGAYQRGQGVIAGSAGAQVRVLAESNEDSTRKLEEESARKSMRPEQQKTQQINDEYSERLRSYQKKKDQELRSTELTEQDKLAIQDTYNRRVIAADQEKNAQLRQQAKETQDKLAGQLEGLFKNPQNYLKNFGTHAMAEAGAGVLVQMQQHMPGGKGGQGTTADKGGWRGAIFGGGLTGHGKHGAGLPGALPGTTAAGAAQHLAGMSTLSISSATISISSATITGGGVGAGTAGATDSRISSGGSSLSAGTEAGGGGTAGGDAGGDLATMGDSFLSGSVLSGKAGTAGASAPGGAAKSTALSGISGLSGLYSQAKNTGMFGGGDGVDTRSC